MLYLLYPPDPAHRSKPRCAKGALCQREGITINIFLLPSWSQSRKTSASPIASPNRTKGRVFFTAGHDLDRYVVWDYLARRRELVN